MSTLLKIKEGWETRGQKPQPLSKSHRERKSRVEHDTTAQHEELPDSRWASGL